MKNKRKLIHRIGALLCALVVAVSAFGESVFYASEVESTEIIEDIIDNEREGFLNGYSLEWSKFRNETNKHEDSFCSDAVYYLPYDKLVGYDYYMVMRHWDTGEYRLFVSNVPFEIAAASEGELRKGVSFLSSEERYAYYYSSSDGINWSSKKTFSSMEITKYYYGNVSVKRRWTWLFCESNYWVINKNVSGGFNNDTMTCYYYWEPTAPFGSYTYNSNLGYLQNMSVQNQYLRGEVSVGGIDIPLYYDDAVDTLKRVWKHDLISTTDIDLSSGDFSVRHYVKQVTVEGYKKEDIIEESQLYFMGEYDASQGSFEYLQSDYDEKLESLGYEGLGFVDLYLKGYFVLQHHYFQIVNNDTNEVGAYLHIFPKNDDGDLSFEIMGNEGVELGFEGVDLEFNIDESAPSGEVGESVGHGATYEEAEQQANEATLGDFEGVDVLTDNLEAYASQISNVTKGLGALLGSAPPFMLGLLGLGVALTVLIIVMKGIRG